MGDLAVTRSLGDCSSHPYVTNKPHLYEGDLTPDDEFLVLACDGLWDEIEDEDVVELIKQWPPEYASIMLRDYAFLLGSADNISVMVIFFRHNSDGSVAFTCSVSDATSTASSPSSSTTTSTSTTSTE
jgi:protein phosphatase PTC1